uniref:Uncharacterized protein n=1 Tax=Rhizophagus irregularis (strain DAOM 181602 / DAOM 197198 / MUCL 43194) TaxID=747089 RepID=U9SP98_RHIID
MYQVTTNNNKTKDVELTKNFFYKETISIKEHTTLNDDFKKRLKDENRKTGEKEIGEKRPILESPQKREVKKEEVTKKVKKQG